MATLFDASPTTTTTSLKQQHNDLYTATESNATGTVTESTSSPPLQNNTDAYQIRVLGIADQGAKSRVETQIRLTIELLNNQGEKVEDWSHIRLPAPLLTTKRRNASTSTLSGNKRRSLEQQQQQQQQQQQSSSLTVPEESILHLRASVICESDANRKVKMCQRCVWREWKRADRKKAGRRLGTTVYDETLMERERHRILLFNSDPLLVFNSGECVLPTRITCYSRHHDERQGFRIKFTMHDHCDNLVGAGTSPPIMITDDHKNLSKLGDKRRRRRKQKPAVSPVNESLPTPEEEALATFDHQDAHMLLATTATEQQLPLAKIKQESLPQVPADFLFDSMGLENTTSTTKDASSMAPSSLDHTGYLDPCLFFPNTPPTMQDIQLFLPSLLSSPSSPTESGSPGSSSPTSPLTIASTLTSPPLYQHHHQQQQQQQQLQQHELSQQEMMHAFLPPLSTLPPPMMLGPKIERMIPDQATTEGGAEITLLGSNFYEGLTCYFGDKPALTAYWSPTTLVCTVPSSLHAGTVSVTLDPPSSSSSSSSPSSSPHMSSLSSGHPPQLFTYTPSYTSPTEGMINSSTHHVLSSSSSSSSSSLVSTKPSLLSFMSSNDAPPPPAVVTTPGDLASGWDEQSVQTLTWQVLNLNMAQTLHDARQIALKLIQL
ncbi:hypothetical protein BCR42DRAFT_179725 [Absidia repens]|uniref:IPT/TIG domain-containing protein n=1 Tax=Absidia repens TaxID=90262 RepID=A0A1X2HYJ3_9FUNG|nr:hypothetical protein BCR42DRAFT_179725 [Absidia repens]